MELKNHNRYQQRFHHYDAACSIRMKDGNILLEFDGASPSAVRHAAEEMENMGLCSWAETDGSTIQLMHPDFGLFADEEELAQIVKDLFEEENYEIIF